MVTIMTTQNPKNTEKFGIKFKFLDDELWLINDRKEIISFDSYKEAEAKLKKLNIVDALINEIFVAKLPKENMVK